MKNVIALVGDYWHAGDMIREALGQAAEAAGGIALAFAEHGELKERLKERPDAVVLFKQNPLNAPEEPHNPWMSPETEAAIIEYVKGGGRWLAWHTGMAGYDKDGAYVEMLRGRFLHHPKMSDVTYTRASDGAEVMTLFDEHYFVEADEARTNVFLRSRSADGESLAGWEHGYGEGKVCCLTPAHAREALLDPKFQALLAERLRLLLA
jgi:Trehalose utilisation.